MKKSYRRDYEHYDSVKRKYKSKEAYLVKGDLEVFKNCYSTMNTLSFFVVLILYIAVGGYFPSLANFDLTLCILNLIFTPIFYKKVLTGEIEAYYRRSYKEIKTFIEFAVYMIKSAYVRVFIVYGAYFLNLFFSESRSDISKYSGALLRMFINPKATVIAVVFFFSVVYILFYQEKYTTVRDYSNFVVKEVRKGSTPGGAHNTYTAIQDKFYDIKEFANVKADREDMKDLERFTREINNTDRYNPNGEKFEKFDEVDLQFSEVERDTGSGIADNSEASDVVKCNVNTENVRRTSRR